MHATTRRPMPPATRTARRDPWALSPERLARFARNYVYFPTREYGATFYGDGTTGRSRSDREELKSWRRDGRS